MLKTFKWFFKTVLFAGPHYRLVKRTLIQTNSNVWVIQIFSYNHESWVDFSGRMYNSLQEARKDLQFVQHKKPSYVDKEVD